MRAFITGGLNNILEITKNKMSKLESMIVYPYKKFSQEQVHHN